MSENLICRLNILSIIFFQYRDSFMLSDYYYQDIEIGSVSVLYWHSSIDNWGLAIRKVLL